MSRSRSRLALVPVMLAAGAAILPPSGSATPDSATPGLANLWVARYDGSAHQTDDAKSLAVGPDGARVFVTGYSNSGPTTRSDFVTVAHDASTGALLWAQEYNGPADGADGGTSVAVAPDGSKVFVTGYSPGTNLRDDYVTLAYDAGSGALLWSQRYNGPGNSRDDGNSLGVSPDGSMVFVTGGSRGASSYQDYATLAYDAAPATFCGSSATTGRSAATTKRPHWPSPRTGPRSSSPGRAMAGPAEPTTRPSPTMLTTERPSGFNATPDGPTPSTMPLPS